VIVSGRIGEEATVQAMRAGAADYVLKDRLETLASAMERVMARTQKIFSNGVNSLHATPASP
jgi:DNA-binding NarL/FixJ family response regulator